MVGVERGRKMPSIDSVVMETILVIASDISDNQMQVEGFGSSLKTLQVFFRKYKKKHPEEKFSEFLTHHHIWPGDMRALRKYVTRSKLTPEEKGGLRRLANNMKGPSL
jgi:FMN-dependent NADH-azoreductase